MSRATAASLLIILVLPACRASRTVASGTARVVTAPAHFVGRRFHRGEDEAGPPEDRVYEAPIVTQTPPPPRTVAAAAPSRPRTAVTETSVAASAPERTATPKPSPSASPASSRPQEFPIAKAVPGKPGYVFSPFDPAGGYVDVTGYQSGAKVKDPYSQKIFLVP